MIRIEMILIEVDLMAEQRETDAMKLLPLKPVVFQVILILTEGERHGWSIVKELEERLTSWMQEIAKQFKPQ